MKFKILFIVTAFITSTAISQQRFQVSPNPNSLTFSKDTTDAVCYSWLKNLTSDTLFMKWKRIKNVTSPWTTTMCDPVICWNPTKDSSNFMLLPEQDSARFWIHFNPYSKTGKDSAIYTVWETAYPESKVKAVFYGEALVSAVSENLSDNHTRFIQNLSGDKIYLNPNTISEIKELKIINTQGIQYRINLINNQWINIKHLPAGIYFLQIISKKNTSSVRKFIVFQ